VFNLLNLVKQNIEDWRQLHQMVKQDLDGFKRQWRTWAAQELSKPDWATTDVISISDDGKRSMIKLQLFKIQPIMVDKLRQIHFLANA